MAGRLRRISVLTRVDVRKRTAAIEIDVERDFKCCLDRGGSGVRQFLVLAGTKFACGEVRPGDLLWPRVVALGQ